MMRSYHQKVMLNSNVKNHNIIRGLHLPAPQKKCRSMETMRGFTHTSMVDAAWAFAHAGIYDEGGRLARLAAAWMGSTAPVHAVAAFAGCACAVCTLQQRLWASCIISPPALHLFTHTHYVSLSHPPTHTHTHTHTHASKHVRLHACTQAHTHTHTHTRTPTHMHTHTLLNKNWHATNAPPGLFNALEAQLAAVFSELGPSYISELMWAFATVKHPLGDPLKLVGAAGRLLAQPCCPPSRECVWGVHPPSWGPAPPSLMGSH